MKTYAVTSGKGGVGKTNVSANLGISLSNKGQRVTLFDGDIGLANLDVILGVRATCTFQDVLAGTKTLAEAMMNGPCGVKFVAGGSGIESLVNMTGPRGDAFLAELNDLERQTDSLIFDTGAGIDENVMTFLSAADEIILVTTPDPASLTDGYATVKAILGRKPDAVIRVIMNMVDDDSQGKLVFAKLNSISQQFLGTPLKYAGSVRLDPRAVNYIRQRQPFTVGDPNLPASMDIARIAGTLMGEPVPLHRVTFADRLKTVFAGLAKAS